MDFNDKVLGTADYLAPEQALNSHQVDHRADLYGLGCTMYFLLTGHAPFPDGTIAQRIARHQKQMPKEIRKIRPECPGELEGICWKLLQKDPKFRYASAAQTAEVLQNWLVKYRAQKPVLIGGSSSVNLGDESETGSSASSKSASSIDTVSNRGSDTMGGKSGSSITNLSTSDSGVLVKVGSSVSGSDASSRVDLQAEIARRSRRGVSSAHGSSSAHGASQSPPSVSSTNQPSGPSGTFPPQVTNSPLPTATGPKFIWIIGLIFMFILAVLLGVVIARLTAPMGTPPAESTGNAMISSPGTEFRT